MRILKSIKILALVGLGLVSVFYERMNGATEILGMKDKSALERWKESAKSWLYRFERKSRKILVFILNVMVSEATTYGANEESEHKLSG